MGLKIVIDVDETLTDHYTPLCAFHHQRGGVAITRDQITDNSLEELWEMTHEEVKGVYHAFHDVNGLLDLEPLPDAVNTLQLLASEHSLNIVTARNSERSAAQTIDWLDKHFGALFDNIYFTDHQPKLNAYDLVSADLVIEDSVEPIHECFQANIPVLILDQLWNRDLEKTQPSLLCKRIYSWRQVPQVLSSGWPYNV